MGSEAFERLGLGRSKEGALDYPEKMVVIGVDVDADVLIAKYKGCKQAAYAAEVIRAVVQKYRTAGDPPDYFVRSLRGGVNEPVILTDLGADAKGKSWAVVVDGRQRALGLRIVNRQNKAASPPLPVFKLAAVFRAFKHEGAGLAASLVKVSSNVRVARTLSQRADDALDLDSRGVGHEDIAPLVEAQTVEEVAALLALAACVDSVKADVDAGKLALSECVALSKKDPDEQERMRARKVAAPKGANGKGDARARDAAAPPAPKARPAKFMLAVSAKLLATVPEARHEEKRFSVVDLNAIVRALSGDEDDLSDRGVSDEVRALFAAVKDTAKKGRITV